MKSIYTRSLATLVLAISSLFTLEAGISCPPDVFTTCDTDIYNLAEMGEPTLTGFHSIYPAYYVDEENLTACNEGTVERRWYVDMNGNNNLDTGEPSCIQTIHLSFIQQNIQIFFPPNAEYECIDDIEYESPYWYGGPCDLIGYTYEDDIYEFSQDACYKIVRNFTVIDWCYYNPTDPNWNGYGIWNHIQIIKVIERDPPEIANCDDVTLALNGQGCNTEFTITQQAEDTGDCSADELLWWVKIDLWNDKTIDYEYAYFLTGDQNIPPLANGEELSITLPELVNKGTHNIEWKVKDQCGNISSCETIYTLEDQKAPTPYCFQFLSATLNAEMEALEVWPQLFKAGDAYDNCTNPESIRYSFSDNVNDTIRYVTCDDLGLQFYRIYVTDEYGNQDYCEVFLLVFDNESCNFRFSPTGRVADINGLPLADADIMISSPDNNILNETISDENGAFTFSDVAHYEDSQTWGYSQNDYLNGVDLSDLIILQKQILEGNALDMAYQYIAADIDNDGKVRSSDLFELRDLILGKIDAFSQNDSWKLINADQDLKAGNSVSLSDADIRLFDYDGSLDFTAVKIGDINRYIETENPTDDGEIYDNLNLVAKISGKNNITTYEFSTDNSLPFEGFQLEFKLPEHKDLKIFSQGISVDPASYYVEGNTLRMLWVNPSGQSIYNESLFSIELTEAAESNSISLEKTFSKAYSQEYDKSNQVSLSLENNADEAVSHISNNKIESWPNPFSDKIMVSGKGIHLVELSSLEGTLLYRKKINAFLSHKTFEIKTDLNNGIYLLTVHYGDKVKNMLVTKL